MPDQAKRILIIAGGSAGIDAERALTKLGHHVDLIPSVVHAASRIRGVDVVCLAGAAAEADAVRALKASGVPMLRIAEPDTPPTVAPAQGVLAVIWGWAPESLGRMITEVASRSMYPPPLCDAVERATLAALETGFAVKGRVARSFIRSDPRLSGEVNAVVPFGGTRTRGRVVVSGRRETIVELLGRSLDAEQAATQGHIDGFAAELGNLSLGHMHRYFRGHDVSISMGYPLRLRGRDVRLHYLADAPTLNLVLGTEAGDLHVGFCTFYSHGQQRWEQVDDDAPTGELTFL